MVHGYNSSNSGSYGSAVFGWKCQNSKSYGVAIGTANVRDTNAILIIGNGNGNTDQYSNCFSVDYSGHVKAASTITGSTTADYAEYFEWADGNPDGEDRVGYFVTFDDEDKIRIANSGDEYILGIVSGNPFVCGNGDCDTWNKMYLRDEFNRVITQKMPALDTITEINKETGEIIEKKILKRDEEGNIVYEDLPKVNPEYDQSQKYIARANRPEWSPIGMLGKLIVYDDGTCEPNKYCTVNEEGKATSVKFNTSGKCYRVLRRISENLIEVIFK